MRLTMEFKDLPSDVQKTAAHTLHSVGRGGYGMKGSIPMGI